MDLKQRAKELFANHPTAGNELHFTTDRFGFFDKSDAEGHATTLKEKDVVTITREEAEKYSEVKATDYSKMNKAQLTEEANKRELDITEAKTVALLIELLKKDDEAKANEEEPV